MGFAVRDFFLNGGSQAVIVRLYHSPDTTKDSTKLPIGKLALEGEHPPDDETTKQHPGSSGDGSPQQGIDAPWCSRYQAGTWRVLVAQVLALAAILGLSALMLSVIDDPGLRALKRFQALLIIGGLGLWRWGWCLFQCCRAAVYRYWTFPRLRRLAELYRGEGRTHHGDRYPCHDLSREALDNLGRLGIGLPRAQHAERA